MYDGKSAAEISALFRYFNSSGDCFLTVEWDARCMDRCCSFLHCGRVYGSTEKEEVFLWAADCRICFRRHLFVFSDPVWSSCNDRGHAVSEQFGKNPSMEKCLSYV